MFYRVLVSNFTEEQLDRYEMYRRSAFPKASIKRVMKDLLYEYILSQIPVRSCFTLTSFADCKCERSSLTGILRNMKTV
jgi:hypothetical protein